MMDLFQALEVSGEGTHRLQLSMSKDSLDDFGAQACRVHHPCTTHLLLFLLSVQQMLHFGPDNFRLRVSDIKYKAFCSCLLNAICQYIKGI